MYLGLNPLPIAQTGSLGVDVLVSTGLMSTGVGAPVGAALLLGGSILDALHIGSGRTEADAIVPVQNAIDLRLQEINRGINTASIPQLQAWRDELIAMGAEFRRFVTDPRFTDGRASTQALDTIMPLIDGTDSSGYPCQLNKWGNPCNGGTIGTIERRAYAMGGALAPPQITQGGMGPTLQYQLPGLPYIPQSGFLPPVSPVSRTQNAGVITVAGSSAGLSTEMLLAGAAAVLFFGLASGRRRK